METHLAPLKDRDVITCPVHDARQSEANALTPRHAAVYRWSEIGSQKILSGKNGQAAGRIINYLSSGTVGSPSFFQSRMPQNCTVL